MRKPLIACALLAAVALGCATYTGRMTATRDLYYRGAYEDALGSLDELLAGAGENDRSLYLLERGKVNLAAGRYDSAIVDLQAAERRFREIEGTVSVTGQLKSYVFHEGFDDYQPGEHEKILINAYLMLAYWLTGDMEGAYVERNRTITRLNQFLDGVPLEKRRRLEVPFARYLAALLYETEGRAEDARIEYDIVREIAPGAAPAAVNPHVRELVVFVEAGRAPVKVSTEIRGMFRKDGGLLFGTFDVGDREPLVVNTAWGAGFDDLTLGKWFTFSFPRYERQPYDSSCCAVVVDGIEAGRAALLDDVGETAVAALEQDMGKILLRSAIRSTLKLALQNQGKRRKSELTWQGMLGKVLSSVEKADTRSWQTLPAAILVYRLEVGEEQHEVSLAGGVDLPARAVDIRAEAGKKRVVFFSGAR
ncbi:MAG: hypothetical protein JW876_05090 [Candidatus Krumholzibacteriota bacterium]|nr:hypothetical protein [Candidatus Krumholzibacteriota bacterium]